MLNLGMVENYISGAAAAHFARRRERLRGVTTPQTLAARAAEVRAVCAEILGKFPDRCALNLKSIRTLDREGYSIHVLSWESLPGVLTTANLYLPPDWKEFRVPSSEFKDAKPLTRNPEPGTRNLPGVVCFPDHWPEGKAHTEYQRLGQLLARRGIAALIFDLVGQGERQEFYDATLRRSWVGKSVLDEHTHLGNLLFLTGHHLANWMVWDAIRGLDVLVEHFGIDPRRLGAIGVSASGSLARILCCLDERLAAAAIVADNCEPESLGGEDAEQNLFDGVARGISALDLLAPFAPRPLLLGYCSQDNPQARMEACLAEVRNGYALLGAGENVRGVIAQGPHSLLKELRALAAEHFATSFGLKEERVREPETPPELPEVLNCTETGQIANSLNAVSVFQYHKTAAREYPPALHVPRDAAGAHTLQDEIRDRFVPYLRLPEPAGEISSAVESRSRDWGYLVEKGRLVVDEGFFIPYSFYALPEREGSGFRIPGSEFRVNAIATQNSELGKQNSELRTQNSELHGAPVVLALHERGIAGISNQGALITGFAEAGVHVMAIDVCGVGETRLQPDRGTGILPESSGMGMEHGQDARATDAYDALLCGSEAQWARHALNAGLSLFGLRVFSVLRTLSFLKSNWGVDKNRVSLLGAGRGALWALFAAALDRGVSRVALLRGLASYRMLIEHRRHNHHFSIYLPGCLREFDLPQVAACAAPRPLTLINSVNQRKERCGLDQAEREYALTTEMYKLCGAAPNLSIRNTDSAPETLAAVIEAITGRQSEPRA